MEKKKINVSDISVSYLLTSIALWLMTIIWSFNIFMLSGETGSQSSDRSRFFSGLMSYFFHENVPEVFIRKFAHGFEFGFLALLIFLSLHTTNKISKSRSYANSSVKVIKSDNEVFIMFSLWLSVLYAISDEYHQLFVDGRSGSIVDVGIDLVGIIVMLLLIRLFYTIRLKIDNVEEIRY